MSRLAPRVAIQFSSWRRAGHERRNDAAARVERGTVVTRHVVGVEDIAARALRVATGLVRLEVFESALEVVRPAPRRRPRSTTGCRRTGSCRGLRVGGVEVVAVVVQAARHALGDADREERGGVDVGVEAAAPAKPFLLLRDLEVREQLSVEHAVVARDEEPVRKARVLGDIRIDRRAERQARLVGRVPDVVHLQRVPLRDRSRAFGLEAGVLGGRVERQVGLGQRLGVARVLPAARGEEPQPSRTIGPPSVAS